MTPLGRAIFERGVMIRTSAEEVYLTMLLFKVENSRPHDFWQEDFKSFPIYVSGNWSDRGVGQFLPQIHDLRNFGRSLPDDIINQSAYLLDLWFKTEQIFKDFPFHCNPASAWNSMIHTILKGNHPRIIPVKFHCKSLSRIGEDIAKCKLCSTD